MPKISSPGLWLALCTMAAGCGGGAVTLPPTAIATVAAASATPGLLYAAVTESPAEELFVFSTAALGKVAPLRMFYGYRPFGADRGGVWSVSPGGYQSQPSPVPTSNSSVTHYNPQGQKIASIAMQPDVGAAVGATDAAGNIYVAEGGVGMIDGDDIYPCYWLNGAGEIDEYAPGSKGLATPFRTIYGDVRDFGATCDSSSMTIDRRGNVWIADGLFGESFQELDWRVLEYAANTTGSAPLRSIDLGLMQTGPSIAVDSADNVYVGTSSDATGVNAALRRYPPGSNHPTTILTGDVGYFVAVDGHDSLYILVDNSNVIKELKPGGSVPIPLIDVSTPQYSEVAGLAVTR